MQCSSVPPCSGREGGEGLISAFADQHLVASHLEERLLQPERLESILSVVLDRRQEHSSKIIVSAWYGQVDGKTLEITSNTALWYRPGTPVLPVRWVLVRDPDAKRAPQAFFSTDIALEPADIIALFVRRWQIEVTFAETRAHLGVETQRQWSDHAIARTTPALLGLYSPMAATPETNSGMRSRITEAGPSKSSNAPIPPKASFFCHAAG